MFGMLKSWASSVCRAVKKVASKVSKRVKRVCSKVWNAFTGKNYANEAESILATVEKKYGDAKQIYENSVADSVERIEAKVSQLNLHKQAIYGVHFKRFIEISRRLHNVTVKGQPFEELFNDNVLALKTQTDVRGKSEIMLIDFNKMGFLDTLGIVLTLGMFSRKKAKESLKRAKEEQARVEEEIAKMESQTSRLRVIEESIDNTVGYFDGLIENYSKLLDRFEYGIQTQSSYLLADKQNVLVHKLNFKQLPVVHLEEFRDLFNLSIILKQMANLGYLSKKGKLLKSDNKKAKKLFKMSQLSKISA